MRRSSSKCILCKHQRKQGLEVAKVNQISGVISDFMVNGQCGSIMDDAIDIHPKNKCLPSERLAWAALNLNYNLDLESEDDLDQDAYGQDWQGGNIVGMEAMNIVNLNTSLPVKETNTLALPTFVWRPHALGTLLTSVGCL